MIVVENVFFASSDSNLLVKFKPKLVYTFDMMHEF